MTPHDFLDAIRNYCTRFHASVTSYGRTPAHNTHVGGVLSSAHQFWLAADVVYDEVVPELIRRDVAKRLGLLLIVEGKYDHLQPLTWSAG